MIAFWLPSTSNNWHLSGVEISHDEHWSVFVLRNPAGRCFVGHTDDLAKLMTTADVEVARWTGQPGPWLLVWQHDGLAEAAARKYETSLKKDKETPRFYARTALTPLDVV